MKCPDCRTHMEFEALTCRCGWRASAAPKAVPVAAPVREAEPPMSDDQVRAQRAAISAQIQQWVKRFRRRDTTGTPFERWCLVMTQQTVDLLVRQSAGESSEVLERLRRACVIDDRKRLVPVENRTAMREAEIRERARADAELRAHLGREEHPA